MRRFEGLGSGHLLSAFAAGWLVLLGGCAAPAAGLAPPGAAAAAAAPQDHPRGDPFESLNRGLFRFGRAVDRAVVRPIIGGYRRITPQPVRHAVSNVLQNLNEPVVFVNDVLQAHFGPAGRTAVRFVANSTVGVAGVFDPAAKAGLPHHDNGFGSTLGHYGVGPGPYIYVPVLGPTSLRDAIGEGVDYATDPLTWSKFRGATKVEVARTVLSLAHERLDAEQDLRTLDQSAADPYATTRSVYLQSRQAEISGPETTLEPLPELPPESPPPATTAPDQPSGQPLGQPLGQPSDQPAAPPPAGPASPERP
ncbi:MAG: VacJ family lipoprotein [Phenylobacterium sp.]|nr:VacJ family lipoprotein [Phenylobacterium sp.]